VIVALCARERGVVEISCGGKIWQCEGRVVLSYSHGAAWGGVVKEH
jgi:hypothetical protein